MSRTMRPRPPLRPNPKLSTFPYGGGEWPGYWTEAMERIARFEADELDGATNPRRQTLRQRLMQARSLVLAFVALVAMVAFACALLFTTGTITLLTVVVSAVTVVLVVMLLIEQLNPDTPSPSIAEVRKLRMVERERTPLTR